ncbi:sensor histidine kinase [Sphingobacterium tabacisoli]|uniref:Signal transduction histidine kinase internal region domain-containing protein n=1 Tax=Sphingobacterium tabacisoli TaxID=2044855 RepID=A0ABW5L6N3_9SPHI|nr:hypothetical protein [Sphingobacterium tabacisoli]
MSVFLKRIFNKEKIKLDDLLVAEAKLSLEQSKLDKQLLLAHFKNEQSISADLGSYLQDILQSGNDGPISLTEELKNLERYVGLYGHYRKNEIQVLYDFPLQEEIEVIAPFILFPLIQNALHYGYHVDAKFPVRVRGRLLGKTLTLEVSNRINHYLVDQRTTDIISFFRSRLDYEYPSSYDLILNSNSNIFKASLRLKLDD